MNQRWIQNRRHGVARIEPRLAIVAISDRLLFIASVMFASFGFFVVGAMPVEVLGGISATCFAGDAMIAVRNVVRAQVRPPAQVTNLPSLR
jgi:hypothetical protein